MFTTKPVDLEQVRRTLAAQSDVEIVDVSDTTLEVRMDGVLVDIVSYAHALLVAPAAGPSEFATAGLLDLATMKLAAIARRGKARKAIALVRRADDAASAAMASIVARVDAFAIAAGVVAQVAWTARRYPGIFLDASRRCASAEPKVAEVLSRARAVTLARANG